jgi:hypothetical protein
MKSSKSHLSERPKSLKGQFKSEDDLARIDPFLLMRTLIQIRGQSYQSLKSSLGGISRNYICEILNGSKIPRRDVKEKVANFFDLPMNFIWKL